MKTTNRFAALMLSVTLGVGALALPLGARASEEGKRNTTLALGAAAAALLITQKNKLPGVVAGAAAAYAYTQYDASIRDRHRREGDYGYYPNEYRHEDYRRQGDYRHQEDYRGGDRQGYHSENRNRERPDNYNNNGGYRNGSGSSQGGYRDGESGSYRNGDYEGRGVRAAGSRTARSGASPR